MGASSSKKGKEPPLDPYSWSGAPLETIVNLSPRNVKICNLVFNEFAIRPQTLCIIRFDNGEVHRYQPSSMHKLKFENEGHKLAGKEGIMGTFHHLEEGVRMIHDKRGPGVIQDITRQPELVIMEPDHFVHALDLLLGHDGLTAKMLRPYQRQLFREADHDGNRLVDFVEFLSFCQRFAREGAGVMLRSADKTALMHASKILQTWSEAKSDLKKMSEDQALCFVDLFSAIGEGQLEVPESEDKEKMKALEEKDKEAEAEAKRHLKEASPPAKLGA